MLDGVVLIAKDTHILISETSSIKTSPPTPFSLSTQFPIGSVTKQMTACAVLKALEKKIKISPLSSKINEIKNHLFLPIAAFLPSKDPIWKGAHPEWIYQVTLHHLLTNTSGIPNYTETKEYTKKR